MKCARTLRTEKGTTKVSCANCNKIFITNNSYVKKSKSGNNFCSRSCAATYNNKNKSYGARRSKLELYIENKLKSEFPDLDFKSNDKSTIGSELDFYFPSLKLAIEINGPFHYKPIYGEEKFLQIQNNDKLKTSACIEANIKLVIVDNLKNCTKSYANERWNVVKKWLPGFDSNEHTRH